MKISVSYNSNTFSNSNRVYRFASKDVTFKEVDGKPVIILH